jgi:hypothetical protein
MSLGKINAWRFAEIRPVVEVLALLGGGDLLTRWGQPGRCRQDRLRSPRLARSRRGDVQRDQLEVLKLEVIGRPRHPDAAAARAPDIPEDGAGLVRIRDVSKLQVLGG